MARGFYSVVQYCPDVFRDEAVNVGLVLLRIEPHELRVRMTNHYQRVKKLFGTPSDEVKNLKLSVHGMTSRIEKSVEELKTAEDLAAFAASRGNALRLTEPRLAKLDDFEADFDRLFAKLVEEQSTLELAKASPAEVLPPSLNDVFYRLSERGKMWDPKPIRVPISNRRLDVPYAFRNGVVNLIAPEVFYPGKRGENRAATLAIDGQLIQKHRIDGEAHKLIVVSTQENEKQRKEITDHVEPMFRELGVRLVRPSEAEAFAAEVEASAH